MHVRKKEEGKMFQNLDLLTTLLCNNKKPCNSPKPLIEVINHSKSEGVKTLSKCIMQFIHTVTLNYAADADMLS